MPSNECTGSNPLMGYLFSDSSQQTGSNKNNMEICPAQSCSIFSLMAHLTFNKNQCWPLGSLLLPQTILQTVCLRISPSKWHSKVSTATKRCSIDAERQTLPSCRTMLGYVRILSMYGNVLVWSFQGPWWEIECPITSYADLLSTVHGAHVETRPAFKWQWWRNSPDLRHRFAKFGPQNWGPEPMHCVAGRLQQQW